MSEETRDIAIEARTDIRQIKEMLRSHIEETRDHRDGLRSEIEGLKEKQSEHNDLIQQLKGAKFTVSAIAAGITTIGIGGLAKLAGFIR